MRYEAIKGLIVVYTRQNSFMVKRNKIVLNRCSYGYREGTDLYLLVFINFYFEVQHIKNLVVK